MGMGGLNVTHVRRERIPLLWSIVGETALAKGFQVVRTCGIRGIRVTALRKTKLSETEGCTQWEGQRNRQDWDEFEKKSRRQIVDSFSVVYSGNDPVTNEELAEEVARENEWMNE